MNRLTEHAAVRARQRGFRDKDLALVLEHGSDHCDGVVLTNKDAAKSIADYRKKIAQLDRLKGTTVIVEGDDVLTVYRPGHRRMRRMIRDGRSRASHRRGVGHAE